MFDKFIVGIRTGYLVDDRLQESLNNEIDVTPVWGCAVGIVSNSQPEMAIGRFPGFKHHVFPRSYEFHNRQ